MTTGIALPSLGTLKLNSRAYCGQVNSSVVFIYKRNGEEQIVKEKNRMKKLAAKSSPTNVGISGVNFGLTIPGPKGSYMMARIDVACFLPHAEGTEAARAAIAQSAKLVQEELENHAKTVVSYFSEL